MRVSLRSCCLIVGLLAGACACQSAPPPVPTKLPVAQPVPAPLDWVAASDVLHRARDVSKDTSATIAMAPALDTLSLLMGRAVGAAREDHGATLPAGLPAQPDADYILKQFASPSGSLSLGSTSRGRLLDGQEVALDGAHHTVVARARGRRTNFASPMLKAMVLHAAAQVHEAHPGSTLALGNLSRAQGGDIRWSVSHNSGRDADLAFYVRDTRTGARVVAPDLIAFDDQGNSRTKAYPHLSFDVARNWVLAKALLTHPKGHVQYLFISDALKAKLLEHARAQKEPASLIERAQAVLKQPTDSLPHDDHFHLRITCALPERLLGCVDRGTKWAWVTWHEDHLLARVLKIQQALLRTAEPKRALALLDYLDALSTRRAADAALLAGLRQGDPAVRRRALKVALNNYAWSGAALELVFRLIDAPDSTFEHKRLGYRLLRRSVDARVVDRVLAHAQDPQRGVSERALALNALTHHMNPDFIPVLLKAMASAHGKERDEAAALLRRLTNRQDNVEWATASAAERARALGRWRGWLAKHAATPRDQWVLQGFVDAGLDPDAAGTLGSVPALIAMLPTAPPHMVYNINKTLRTLTGRWSSLEQADGQRLAKAWGKWWRRNKKRLLATS